MVNATNVSQKECNTPIKRGGKALSEEKVDECMANGGMILSSRTMATPLPTSACISSTE